MQHYKDYFQHVPNDDFGYSLEWSQEVDRWLEYLYSINPNYYQQNKKRVLKDKQRDEFLGEIKTIYFLGKILGLKIIDIEPAGNGSTKLDLSIEDLSGKLWKVEVKSPSWKGQIWKDPKLTEAQKKARTSLPQYINGEGGSFSSEEEIEFAVEDSIKNALPKFIKGENNLLVIVPNMYEQIITMLGISAMAGGSEAIQGELLVHDIDGLVSVVLVLELVLLMGDPEVKYTHKFIPITRKPELPSNAEFI